MRILAASETLIPMIAAFVIIYFWNARWSPSARKVRKTEREQEGLRAANEAAQKKLKEQDEKPFPSFTRRNKDK